MTMNMTTTTADHGADGRRKTERRKLNLAFDGAERRVAERRAMRDRRAPRG